MDPQAAALNRPAMANYRRPAAPLDPARQLVLRLRDDHNTNLAEMSEAIGRNKAYLHQYLYRFTPVALPEEAREALAARYGVDPNALRSPKRPAAKGPAASTVSSQSKGVIPELDVSAGAGLGAEAVLESFSADGRSTVSTEVVAAEWSIPAPYLATELRIRREAARIISVIGDSMSPTLQPGDRVMINTEDRQPSPPGLFALWDGLGVVVKRIEHIPNSEPIKLLLMSDNDRHRSYERTSEEVSIIGRVVWLARRVS
ncbi:MAG: helix-turn-helix transcriptional regulator [Alphaproteobacteria bacterium]